jgi:hypothetical protein
MLRSETDPPDPLKAVIALGAVALAIALSNCGGNARDDRQGNEAGDPGSGGDSGSDGDGGVGAGGQGGAHVGGTGAGGSSTATYTDTLPNTGTGTCYNDNIITDPPPLADALGPDEEPVCQFGSCDNPTGTAVMGDIYYVPACVPSNQGACCGYPMGPSEYPGSLNCDMNTVYLSSQNECCMLEGSLGCPE